MLCPLLLASLIMGDLDTSKYGWHVEPPTCLSRHPTRQSTRVASPTIIPTPFATGQVLVIEVVLL